MLNNLVLLKYSLNVKNSKFQIIQFGIIMQFKCKYTVCQKHFYFKVFSLVKQFYFKQFTLVQEQFLSVHS